MYFRHLRYVHIRSDLPHIGKSFQRIYAGRIAIDLATLSLLVNPGGVVIVI